MYVNGSPQQQKPQGNLEPWTLDLGPWRFALRLGLSPLPFACPGPLLSFAPLWVLCTGGAQRITDNRRVQSPVAQVHEVGHCTKHTSIYSTSYVYRITTLQFKAPRNTFFPPSFFRVNRASYLYRVRASGMQMPAMRCRAVR